MSRVAFFTVACSLAIACGGDPPGGPVNTGGKPTDPATSVNTDGKPTDNSANTKGKPDPNTMNALPEAVGGPVNTGGKPNFMNKDGGASK